MIMPLPQMLHTITVPRATKASSQLLWQLVMAEGARIRPMAIMMGPVILIMPLPQMLHTITVPRATKASSQLLWQLVMAEGARIRPMAIMMGPVTTGGNSFMMRRMPNMEISRLNITYTRPLSATPAQA